MSEYVEAISLFERLELREYQCLSLEELKALFPNISWNEIGAFLVEELQS